MKALELTNILAGVKDHTRVKFGVNGELFDIAAVHIYQHHPANNGNALVIVAATDCEDWDKEELKNPFEDE